MPIPIMAIIGGFFVSVGVANSVPPLQRFMTYETNKLWQNLSIEMRDAIELRRRAVITEKEYYKIFTNHGGSKRHAQRIWEASKQLLDAGDLLVLKWRKEITEDVYYKKLEALGIDKETADLYEKRSKFYPAPADLVRWQAREVYEPDAIKRYGLLDEIELVEKDAFYKAGMTDEQIENYWKAHWLHPPLMNIFDMLHRTTFDKPSAISKVAGYIDKKPYYHLLEPEDVYEYYRLVEIPPYWRGKWTELSYTPYTRVDVRRMYALGVLNRDEVKKAYLDIGYSDERAEHLTDFAIAYTMPAERDLTRTMIEKAFEIGEINREEFVTYLIELRYDEAEANLIVALKEWKIREDELDDIIATIKLSYTHGLITYNEAISKLDKLNLKATYREKIVASITREKEKVYQLPSKADLVRWAKRETIDLETFTNYMKKIGFQDTEIALWIKEIEEVLKARKTYETEYQKGIAGAD